MGKDKDKKKEVAAKHAKKILSPFEQLHKTFMDDYNDNEIQNRYDGMVASEKRSKDSYNELVPSINDLINRQTVLKMMIIESAKMGFLNAEAVTKLISVEKNLDEKTDKANEYKRELDEVRGLIERYKVSSNNKLFVYWKAIKSLEPATQHWLDWKKPYENRIF